MDIAELQQKQRLGREDAAARLHAIADELASGNSIRLEQGGMTFTARVPDEIDMKVEFELQDDGAEFEIEITW